MQLYARLIDELQFTQEQAEGAVGALLQLARARLSEQDFLQVAEAIPAISDVIDKAPRFVVPPRNGFKARLSRLLGGLGELAPLAEPLNRLRIDKSQIPQCAEIVEKYVDEKTDFKSSVSLWSVFY